MKTVDDETKDEDVPDSVEFLATGRTRVTFDGRVWNLRLPKHGEFKKLRLALSTDTKDMTEDEQFEYMEAWMRDAFKDLADRPLPEAVDDWPAWLCTPSMQARLLVHWRDVPLAPGAPPK